MIVWGARPVELAEAAPAGTIVDVRAEGPVVACGEGGLVLEEIQTEAVGLVGGSEAGMSTARLRLAVTGETMFPPCAPFFLRAWGTSRFPTPLPAHRPTGVGR